MPVLKEEEIKELLFFAHSESLKKDMQKLRKNNYIAEKNDPDYINNYIKFLSISNAFTNHVKKKFKKITGSNFKL